jgi:hypothetical protein
LLRSKEKRKKIFFTKSPDKQCHNAASEKRKKTNSRVSEKSKNETGHEQRIASIKLPQKRPQTAVFFSVAGPSSRMRKKSSIIEFFAMHRHASIVS